MSVGSQSRAVDRATPAAVELNAARSYRALLSRDRRFDGRFFVAVRTTGIYCRPICPSPPPRRENVVFYVCAAAAQAAGFRACRRCRPEAAPGTPAWVGSAALVSRALRLIDDGGLDDADAAAFADRLGVSDRHLRRLFETHLGASPGAVAQAGRVHLARRLLDISDASITDVAHAAGFRSIRQFNHAMRTTFGEPPRALRARRFAADRPVPGAGLRVRLAYRPPFDWTALLGFLAARATPGVEVVTTESYRRTVRIGDATGIVELRPQPTTATVELRLQLSDLHGLPALVAAARRLLDLDADPLRIGRELARSPLLAARVRRHPGLRVPGAWDAFEVVVRAILGQQVTVRGATTLAGRLAATYGTPCGTGDAQLTHLFPTPRVLADADCERIGLPRARAAAIRAAARAVADGTVRFDGSLDTDTLRATLEALPGVGPWTADYVAMRAGGETDAFPSGDLWLRRAAGNGSGPLTVRKLLDTAEAWRPWRAYAAMYLWSGGDHVDGG